MKKYHYSRLPLDATAFSSLNKYGELSPYYYCSEVPYEELPSFLSKYKMDKVSVGTFAKLGNDDRVKDILLARHGHCLFATTDSTEMLTEITRKELLKKSKDETKTRYDNRASVLRGKVIRPTVDFNSFLDGNIGFFFKTGHYMTMLYILDVVPDLKKLYNSGKWDKKSVTTCLTKAINTKQIKINCDCPDFKFRHAYVATIGGFKAMDPENRPAKKTNPDNKGGACKHVLRILANINWIRAVANDVVRLINFDPDMLLNGNP